MDVEIQPGSTLTAVTSGVSAVTVYRDSGLTQAVTLPYALPSDGRLTLYVPPLASFAYAITKADGGVARGNARGLTSAATRLDFAVAGSVTKADGSGTYAALGSSAPSFTKQPKRTLTYLGDFGRTHSYTANGNCAAATNVNDTATFLQGTQSAKIVTKGDGTLAAIKNTALGPLNLTGKRFEAKFYIDDATSMANLQAVVVSLGDTNFANFWSFTLFNFNNSNAPFVEGEWVTVTFDASSITSTTGAPNIAAVTCAQIGFQDKNVGGGTVTGHVQEISYFDAPTAFPNGVVSLTFDDGYASQWTTCRPYLDKYGYLATFYPIVNLVDTLGYVTTAQLKALQAIGHDIAGHAATNTNHDRTGAFTALTATELDTELRTNRDWLNRNGFTGRNHFAYPQGLVNPTVADGVSKYFADSRVIHRSPRETQSPGDIMRIRGYSANDPALLATIQAAVDAAFTNKSWLVLIFHDIVTTPSGGSVPQWSTANFQALIDYINGKGIPVRTVNDVLNTAT